MDHNKLNLHDVLFMIFMLATFSSCYDTQRIEDIFVANENFEIKFKKSGGGITSIRYSKDTTHKQKYRDPNEYFHRLSVEADPDKLTKTEFIHPDGVLGDMKVRLRLFGEKTWHYVDVNEIELKHNKDKTRQTLGQMAVLSQDGKEPEITGLKMTRRFELKKNFIIWTMDFENTSDKPIEIGDIALPIMFNNHYVHNMLITYVQRVFPQAFIAGNASFILSVRCNGEGPYLVMTPLDNTPLEFFEQLMDRRVGEWSGTYVFYIHSAARGPEVQPGSWRQKHTSVTLSASGTKNSKIRYGFKLQWASDMAAVRDVLYHEGLFDVRVSGAMTVPVGESVLFSLRTKNLIDSIITEFPRQTRLEYLGERKKDTHVYRVSFERLGENMLTVKYNNGKYMPLEFFCCQSIETLIKKRAAFVANNQCRDPKKWYHGLFHLWDMEEKISRTPDN